jgi:phosphoglucomutase
MGKVADDMIESVNATDFADIHTGDYQDLLNQGMIEELGEAFDAVYLEVLQRSRLSPELAARHGESLRIVFTGIHGTGGSVIPAALASWGFRNVSVVEAQHAPDGTFPTVHSPNPEEGAALELAIRQAKEQGADLVMGTDPDADRVGIAIPLPDGTWRLMSGQEVAVMLTYYTIHRRRETNNLPANGVVIKTIVTSDLIAHICAANGVELIETLTGFKYIGAWINSWDDEGHRSPPDKVYIFGGEESYGYLLGVHARDKDAVVACCAVAEMTAWCRERGMSLAGLLDEIHSRHGIFQEDGLSLTMEGLAGMRRIERIMANLRQSPPAEMAGRGLSRVRDILQGTVTDASGRHLEQVSLPSENVLELHYGADLKITARPSGTEPKIKFYLAMADLSGLPIALDDLAGRRVRLTRELSALKADLKSLIERME